MIPSMAEALTDRIALTVPGTEPYRAVVTLVLGGVGGRLELPYERTDDLQLAVLAALEAAAGGSVTIEVGVALDELVVSVGPLVDGAGADRALRNVLEKLVDGVAASSREGREWLTLSLARPSSG